MAEAEVEPREQRESVFLSASVTRFGEPLPTRHRVRNLSINGACIDQAAMLRQRQTILIDVGVLAEVGATIMWVVGDLAGLKFAHPIAIGSAKSRTKPEHVAVGWNADPWVRRDR